MNVQIDLEDNSPQFLSNFNSKKKLILQAIGLKAVSIWEQIITAKGVVDTGRFRNSANYALFQNHVEIGSNVKYASYLENGTSRMRARPTLKPTVIDNKGIYENLAKQIMQQ